MGVGDGGRRRGRRKGREGGMKIEKDEEHWKEKDERS